MQLAHFDSQRVAIDVAAWDVDWYVYSTYKVYGPTWRRCSASTRRSPSSKGRTFMLGLEPDDGVVPASLVHYNHPDEIERLIEFLENVL